MQQAEQRKQMERTDPLAFKNTIRDCGAQIAANLTYEQRLQLFDFLVKVAQADGNVCVQEVDALKEVAMYMRLNMQDVDSMLSLGGNSLDEAYKVLEVRANCCAAVRTAGGFVPDAIYNGENHYTAARGYTEGERFGTAVYRDAQGVPRVCVTVMKNMPHGAIHDESRAAWEFMRRYRRPGNGKAVETVPHTESTETECAKQKEERLK